MFNNRRKFFINKDFQSRFILRFVIASTFWAAATVWIFVVLAGRKLEDVQYSTHINIRSTAELLLPSVINSHVLTLVIFAGLLGYAIHELWQKLAVPLTIIKKDIARIADGDLSSTIKLRTDDEFQELAASLDAMRQELRRKAASMKDRHRDVSAAAEQLNRSIWKGNPSRDHAAALNASVRRLKEGLNDFTS